MKNSLECEVQDGKSLAANAKDALERVCSGKALDSLPRYYSPEFVDHVNDMKFHGLEGARRSVELYTKVLSDLEVVVKEQLTNVDRVTSRFVVSGKSLGKTVHINGITISRFQDGLIVEDWSVTDSLGMLRQLGAWRSVALGLLHWRALKQTKTVGEKRRKEKLTSNVNKNRSFTLTFMIRAATGSADH